jgi:glycosyltransferase involved in cell wall biosynthesis
MTPTVSVVIPTRNRPGMLREAVACVLAQLDVPLEVIVVDEGSTPPVTEQAPELLDDPRVRIVRHDEPRGLPAARNAGVAVAAGDWLAFCDDDDLWAPDKLARQLVAADTTGAGWSATGLLVTDLALRPLDHHRVDEPEVKLRHHNTLPAGGSSVVLRRDVFEAAGPFDERLRSSEDWEMWIRVLEVAGPPVCVDAPLVVYRVSPTSMSTNAARMRESRSIVFATHGITPTADDDLDYEEFLVRQLVRGGHRFHAAATFVRLAVRHRRPAFAVKAAVALVAVGVLDQVGERRAVARIPSEWLDETGRWTAALRDHRVEHPVPAAP